MDDTWLASALGPCPTCGNGTFTVVFDGHLRNLLCTECGTCWHAEQYGAHRVEPSTCPGCPAREHCEAARRAYAAGMNESVVAVLEGNRFRLTSDNDTRLSPIVDWEASEPTLLRADRVS